MLRSLMILRFLLSEKNKQRGNGGSMIFPAKVDKLNELLSFIEEELGEKNVPMNITMSFLVAVEEIFVNVASYAYPETEGNVEIEFSIGDHRVDVSFADEGLPFNPLEKKDPDINAKVEDRQIGGLGIYMVKKSMDGIDYEYRDNKNILSFWKAF